MQRNILFYQANFEPEVFRMIEAFERKDVNHFDFFKMKTIRIVDEILRLSNSFAEKEEWFTIKSLVMNFEFLTNSEVEILKKYGNPFSVKFSKVLNSVL